MASLVAAVVAAAADDERHEALLIGIDDWTRSNGSVLSAGSAIRPPKHVAMICGSHADLFAIHQHETQSI